MNISAKIVQRPDFAKVMRNINFGTATGLTKTAKQGQAAVVDSLQSTFTLRGRWFEQNMRHGIKITPAKRDKLQAEVKTAADWLEPHQEGKDKSGKGHRLGVPLWGARPRGSKKILATALRPHALLKAGKAFILDTPKGEIIATVRGRGAASRIVPLYGLEKKVKIKKRPTFREPIEKVVSRHLKDNIRNGIANALRTMR